MAIDAKFVCRSCSYSLPFRRAGFCPSCGDPIDEAPAPKPKKKATAAKKKKKK